MNAKRPDLDRLIGDCQTLMWDVDARRILQEQGVNLTPANFYSSTPLLAELEGNFEAPEGVPLPLYMDVFDHAIMSRVFDELASYATEFDPPEEFWTNGLFTNLDAVSYYCMIRRTKPRRIVEIGSGFSTSVATAAIERNGFGELVAIEPFPSETLRSNGAVTRLIEKKIQDVPVEDVVAMLGQGDLLFIDSTHTVKIGSDCLYIYLRILPAITTHTIVHSHDIFLPFGMLTDWARNQQIYWTEQYLLYAYLLKNPKASVLFGSTYTEKFLAERARAMLPNEQRPLGGGSFWYELNSP